jgi:uncharacterized membrane protein
MGKILQLWTDLRSSLWLVPTILVIASILLAVGLIELDQVMDVGLREKYPRLFAAEAEGARAMLSAIAGSMITVTGVVFSITIVALTLASTQYTSRILRTFMRDRANQIVLGVFLGIFSYCLIVLRTLSGGNNGQFIPSMAVLAAVVLALVGIGFLIFFIHHIAATIQASEIISSITDETLEAIDNFFPDEIGEDSEDNEDDREVAEPHKAIWHVVPSLSRGYIQKIATDSLLEFARNKGTIVKMEKEIGEFVAKGRPLAYLSLEAEPDKETVKKLNAVYAIGSYRTVDQDPAFGIRQLVDIALKALSPGINDTSTAIICIDHLSAILQRAACRRIESKYRYEDGELRVIAKGLTFQSLLRQSYSQILENGEGNAAVIERMIDAVEEISNLAYNARKRALREQLDIIKEVAERSIKTSFARGEIEGRIRIVSELLGNERS